MFSYHDEGAMRPPTVVTTMGELKQQHGEPDWCSPPTHQQREAREQQYNYGMRGGVGANSILADERDIRMPTHGGGNYHYSGGRGQSLSPRNFPQSQNQLSSREAASYMAAIKSVNESMQSSGHAGSVTVLRGLWKVFDASMSELGMELNDSLSNKAIFEGKRSVYYFVCTSRVIMC